MAVEREVERQKCGFIWIYSKIYLRSDKVDRWELI